MMQRDASDMMAETSCEYLIVSGLENVQSKGTVRITSVDALICAGCVAFCVFVTVLLAVFCLLGKNI